MDLYCPVCNTRLMAAIYAIGEVNMAAEVNRPRQCHPLATEMAESALTQAMAIINKARRELGIPEGQEWDGSITGKQGMNALCQADGYSDSDYVADRSYPMPGTAPRWPK